MAGRGRGGDTRDLNHGTLELWCKGWGLGGWLSCRGVVLPPMAIKVRGTVKLLPTKKALVYLNVTVEDSMTVEVVCAIEPLSTDLAEELLVLRVWVCEDVPLKLVLAIEALSTDLARNSDFLALPTLHACKEVSNNFNWLRDCRSALDESQTLLVYWVPV